MVYGGSVGAALSMMRVDDAFLRMRGKESLIPKLIIAKGRERERERKERKKKSWDFNQEFARLMGLQQKMDGRMDGRTNEWMDGEKKKRKKRWEEEKKTPP